MMSRSGEYTDPVLASDLRIEERDLEAGRVELAGDAGNGTRLDA